MTCDDQSLHVISVNGSGSNFDYMVLTSANFDEARLVGASLIPETNQKQKAGGKTQDPDWPNQDLVLLGAYKEVRPL